MATDEEIQEHYSLSLRYLQASDMSLEKELIEPALFNGIHALELSIKAILFTKMDGPIHTHNVGGLLGQYFKEELGEGQCKKLNRILIMYNLPRYPGMEKVGASEVKEVVNFIRDFIHDQVHRTLMNHSQHDKGQKGSE